MHQSIRMEVPCEFINVVPMNPLISKCQIKVCYVGQAPNRNRSIITKEVATQMANTLPGSPIVGFYNEETGDFEEHNREIYFEDGKIKLKDTTRPYGFIDLNAKCWFQKFSDDGIEHEYLMTEGYLWTGQYPESKRVIEKGNNHSMELDENLTQAQWAKVNNSKGKFFIINESVFSKLCILGEQYEPCFEGSTITGIKFSFDDSFNQRMFSMMEEMTKYITKGGETMPNTDEILEVSEELEAASAVSEEDIEFKNKKNEEEADDTSKDNAEEDSGDSKASSDSESKEEDNGEDTTSDDEEDEDEEKKKDKKAKYNLDEIPEYVELSANYSALETERNSLNNTITELKAQIESLTSFKVATEKKEKEDMINSFYMLSDAEKQDVIDNIDKYSLDEIEAKLSVICVRNKVSFNLDEDKEEETSSLTFNLDEDTDTAVPAWVKAVMKTQENKF